MPDVMRIKNSPELIMFGLQLKSSIFSAIITYLQNLFYKSYSLSKKDSIRSCLDVRLAGSCILESASSTAI